MNFTYKPQNVCSSKVTFDLNDGVISNVVFTGGCNGNLKAIATLCEGKKATEVIELLKGNTCGMNTTSCADQFALALEDALKKQ